MSDDAVMTMSDVRRAGALIETVHAVVYFAPEAAEAYRALGLKGYWMGYFASRSAALGAADAALVTELFGGFAPAKVARAIPDAWSYAGPEAVTGARSDAASAALARLVGQPDLGALGPLLSRLVADLDCARRPLARAHREVLRTQPAGTQLGRVWQACTVLREHRGDGHLQAVAEAGLVWPEPHLLLAASGRLDPRQQQHRGWDDEAWERSRARVAREDAPGYAALEARTDELAAEALPPADLDPLIRGLEPLAAAILDGEAIPFPNAMGLADPRPEAARAPHPAGEETPAAADAGGRPCCG